MDYFHLMYLQKFSQCSGHVTVRGKEWSILSAVWSLSKQLLFQVRDLYCIFSSFVGVISSFLHCLSSSAVYFYSWSLSISSLYFFVLRYKHFNLWEYILKVEQEFKELYMKTITVIDFMRYGVNECKCISGHKNKEN